MGIAEGVVFSDSYVGTDEECALALKKQISHQEVSLWAGATKVGQLQNYKVLRPLVWISS